MSDSPAGPRPTKTPIPDDNTGLTLWYRILWRLEYWGVSVVGPAQQTLERDPKEKLRRERARRVAAARAARPR